MMRIGCRLLVILLLALPGCGQGEEGVAKKTGAKVGEVLTDFATGIGKGVDKQMTVNAELSPALKDSGISMTVAKGASLDRKQASKGISVYLLAAKPLKTKLIAKALNEASQEIGRSLIDVEFTADDAKYITFAFDDQLDTQLVKTYYLDIKPD